MELELIESIIFFAKEDQQAFHCVNVPCDTNNDLTIISINGQEAKKKSPTNPEEPYDYYVDYDNAPDEVMGLLLVLRHPLHEGDMIEVKFYSDTINDYNAFND